MADTAVESKPKRRPGRPKGAKSNATLQREIAELRKLLEARTAFAGSDEKAHQEAGEPAGATNDRPDAGTPADGADPFAGRPLGQQAAAAGPDTGNEATDPTSSSPAPVNPMGEETAGHVFDGLCDLYDGFSRPLALAILTKRLESWASVPAAKEAWLLVEQGVKLSPDERERLRPPLVRRLALIDLGPNADLWVALGVVFGPKLLFVRAITDPVSGQSMVEQLTGRTIAAAPPPEKPAAPTPPTPPNEPIPKPPPASADWMAIPPAPAGAEA